MALAITRDEWKEIALLPAVLKMFDTDEIVPGDLAASVYGAKYILAEHGADTEIILYTLVDIGLTGDIITLVLERSNGVLKEMGA